MKKLILMLLAGLLSLSLYSQIDFKGVYLGYATQEVEKVVNMLGHPYYIKSFNISTGYCAIIVCVPYSYADNGTSRFISAGELADLLKSIDKSYDIDLKLIENDNMFLDIKDGVEYAVIIDNASSGYDGSYIYDITIRISNIALGKIYLQEHPELLNQNKRYD